MSEESFESLGAITITEADLEAAKEENKESKAPESAQAKPALEGIPEKFKNAEDPVKAMAEAYAALEKKLSQKPKEEPKAETPPENPDGQTPPEDTEKSEAEKALEAENAAKAAGLAPQLKTALEKASDDYYSTGNISDESRKALTDLGIPDEYITSYTQGVAAAEQAIIGAMYQEAGGEARFNDMLKWAATGLSKPEIAAIDKVLQFSQDPEEIKNTITALDVKYTKAVGQEPQNIRGDVGGKGDVFTSEAEVIAAMSDPRYQRGDKAYVKEVEAKLGRSHDVFTQFG